MILRRLRPDDARDPRGTLARLEISLKTYWSQLEIAQIELAQLVQQRAAPSKILAQMRRMARTVRGLAKVRRDHHELDELVAEVPPDTWDELVRVAREYPQAARGRSHKRGRPRKHDPKLTRKQIEAQRREQVLDEVVGPERECPSCGETKPKSTQWSLPHRCCLACARKQRSASC